jgi:hypothetical protein
MDINNLKINRENNIDLENAVISGQIENGLSQPAEQDLVVCRMLPGFVVKSLALDCLIIILGESGEDLHGKKELLGFNEYHLTDSDAGHRMQQASRG